MSFSIPILNRKLNGTFGAWIVKLQRKNYENENGKHENGKHENGSQLFEVRFAY